MSLITTYNLTKSIGPLDIFAGLSLSVSHEARIAVVGPNGIGKTTLLRVLAGEEKPSDGEVFRARGVSVGYLPQEAALDSENTLWEECVIPFDDLRAEEAELARLEAAMGEREQTEEILERYGELQARFELKGGYTYESRVRQVLGGLGFGEEDYAMPLTNLSGGQRTRAFLARLLLEGPDLLILDEPTNHLDIAAVEWLESYLRDWDGGAVIVSHDRYFLDRVCNNVWEMGRAGFETYRGNYSAYLQQRQDRWERREQTFEAEKARLENELDYVKRNIAGQNVNQAKGRLKRLSRQLQAIQQVGLDAMQNKAWHEVREDVTTTKSTMSVEEAHQAIRSLRNPTTRPLELKLDLETQKRSGELVLRSRDLLVGYPGKPLFSTPDLELRRLECAALIGPNGAGKTTFLKTILGRVPPLQGELKLGASLDIGYFAQAHEELVPERTLVEEIESVAPKMMVAEVRSYLARFLFTGDEVFKRVAVLSGGERGRLALAKLALGKANLLLLDEPTNHLDIPSQEILQSVLMNFQGTIILVSHDRYLIDTLATQIWEIDVERSALVLFKGTYSEYRAMLDTSMREGSLKEDSHDRKADAARRARAEKNRALAEERRRQARLEKIEVRVTELESLLATLSGKLEDPPADPGEVRRLGDKYVGAQKELSALMAEWEQLHS